jgi:hypothetical protein
MTDGEDPKPKNPRVSRRTVAVTLLLAALVVAPMWHLHVINRNMPPAKADLVPVWIGARVALQHGDPYSDDTTRLAQIAYYGRALRPSDNVNKMGFAYPAHTLVLFSCIAPASWHVVRLTFLILLPLLTAVSVPLWLRVAGVSLSRGRMALTLLLTLASWPVMWGVHQIQPTLIVAALCAAACFLYMRGSLVPAGLLFAMATIKPQLVGLLIAWLCLSSLLRHQWKFLISFAASLAALLISATWLVPGWLTKWRAAMADYAVYRHLQPDLQLLFGRGAGLFLSIVIFSATAVILWRGRKCSPESPAFGALCSVALAATVCVLPNETTMIYNHVLLIPACFILIFSKDATSFASSLRRVAIAQLVIDFTVVPLSALGETLAKPANIWDTLPYMDFLLPTLVTLFLVFHTWHRLASVHSVGSEPLLHTAHA